VKQLLQDIESSSGWFTSTARKIAKKRPDLYGQPGTPDRVKVKNKLNYLRTLPDNEYIELLQNFGCLPYTVSRPSLSPSRRDVKLLGTTKKKATEKG
jgi:hypothetical protein